MVRRSFTAVIEKNSTWKESFETEPYEAAWATEARWFIRVIDVRGTAAIVPQLSPDGLWWCDEGGAPLVIRDAGLYSFPLRDFGHWLRLRVTLEPAEAMLKVHITLALKE
jgi:hypothetical protein